MNDKYKIIIYVLVITSILLSIYTFLKKSNDKDKIDDKQFVAEQIEDECTDEYKNIPNVATVVATEEKLSANAILILKKYYQKCDHTINEYVELPQELVNMTEKEVQNYYDDWEVLGFEQGKLTLYKEFDCECNEHFKLKIENGKVVIYIDNGDGSETLYEKTDISSEYLTEADLMNMQGGGLEVFGKEELNQIIEDFE